MSEPFRCILSHVEDQSVYREVDGIRVRLLKGAALTLLTEGPFPERMWELLGQRAWLVFGERPQPRVGGFDDATAADIVGSKGG